MEEAEKKNNKQAYVGASKMNAKNNEDRGFERETVNKRESEKERKGEQEFHEQAHRSVFALAGRGGQPYRSRFRILHADKLLCLIAAACVIT